VIDKLLTNVANDLLAVIFDPSMNVQVFPVIKLHSPPNIPEDVDPDDIVLQKPPPMIERQPDAVFSAPPLIIEA